MDCALPGLGAEGWQVCSLPNSLRSLSGRNRRVMERNNDGKKSHGSQNPGIVSDTRVPWHRLSPATRYRGIRSPSDSWLADTDHPSYIYPHGEARRLYPSEAKPACFPREGGRAGAGREQMCGASSTWVLGRRCHHHRALPAARDGPAAGLPPRGYKSPSTGGMGCRDTGRSAPRWLPVLPAAAGGTPQKRGGSSPPPDLLCHPRREGLHQLGLAKR